MNSPSASESVQFCASSDGVRIAWARVGNGPVLVKAANWLTHLEYDWRSPIWGPWVQALSERFSYVRYDTRGCGLSDRDPPEVSLEAWVRDLEAVVDAAQLERFTLLGLSQGGAIAAAYAVRHPERVERLVLYGTFARGRLHRGYAAKKLEEVLLNYKIAEHAWGEDASEGFKQHFAAGFIPESSLEMQRAFAELQRVSSSAAHAVRQLKAGDQLEISDIARRVSCPTLVLHAREDSRIAYEEGRYFATLIPGARFVPLESRNHILLPGEPAWIRLLAELDAFVPRTAAAPRPLQGLTAREHQLLGLLAQGLDNHQIAAHLGVTEKTVRNHVSAIFTKLGVDSRGRAIVLAREAGYGVEAQGR